MEPPIVPNTGVPGESKYNIYLVVGVMLFLPPLGVYLDEGGCNFQVGINIVCWFFFITPSYVHGFGLLAYKKLYPKLKPFIDEVITNLTAEVEGVAAPRLTQIATAMAGGVPDAPKVP